LGGQLVTPFRQERPPFWVWNAGIRQLYMSSYHLAPQNAPAYCEAMNKYNVQYLIGYASSLHSLAMVVLEKGIKVSNLKVAISNAEPLFEHQRSVIEMAFGCPVRDTYGMAEIVAAASECSKGKMHLWPDVGAAFSLHRINQCGNALNPL
jgi:phenylacetate-CoA ligase